MSGSSSKRKLFEDGQTMRESLALPHKCNAFRIDRQSVHKHSAGIQKPHPIEPEELFARLFVDAFTCMHNERASFGCS